jgi:hypothetical protein
MLYPVAVEAGDAKHAFGVVVPDLPAAFRPAIQNLRLPSRVSKSGRDDDLDE